MEKNSKNQTETAACAQKNHQREMEFRLRQKTRPKMNKEGIGITIQEKSPIQKISKNQNEIAACEQKTTNENWKFVSNKKLGLE